MLNAFKITKKNFRIRQDGSTISKKHSERFMLPVAYLRLNEQSFEPKETLAERLGKFKLGLRLISTFV